MMTPKHIRTILYATCTSTALFAVSTFVAHAQPFVPLANADQAPILQNVYSTQGDLAGYINALFKAAIAIGAIAAVLRIAYAGYLYMGNEDMWGNKKQAKGIIADAVLGLFLLLSIYLILYQINPDLLRLDVLHSVSGGTNGTTAPQNLPDLQTDPFNNPSELPTPPDSSQIPGSQGYDGPTVL